MCTSFDSSSRSIPFIQILAIALQPSFLDMDTIDSICKSLQHWEAVTLLNEPQERSLILLHLGPSGHFELAGGIYILPRSDSELRIFLLCFGAEWT